MSENKNDLPNWNLNSIYPSLESDKYKNALEDFKTLSNQIDNLIENSENSTDFETWLANFLPIWDNFCALQNSLGCYAYIIYSVDTTNKKYLDNLSEIEEQGLKIHEQSLKFRAILKNHAEKLQEFFKKFPNFADYEFILNEELNATKHQMSDESENLAAELQRTGGDAWARLQEQLISTLKDEETGKTFNQLRGDAYSTDAEIRKSSYEKELKLLKQNEIAFAACLNNLKGETCTLNKRRSWNKALDRALADSRMSEKVLNALVEALEESLPFWREYLQLKAELLYGTEKKEKGLAFYDLFAPLSKKSESSKNENSLLSKKWTFEEAKNYVIQEYYSFSKPMGDFATKAFQNNWIDAPIKPGKVGGAYCEDFYTAGESRILTNFSGDFSDIITLAHELGHAYHFSCVKDLPFSFTTYPMTLAETASTFAETIVKHDLLKEATENEKINLIEFDLQDACQVLVDILCRFYFERSVFEKRTKGELTAQDFCNLMKDAQEKSYGNGLNSYRHEYMWAVKSHYYSTGLDFYNFPYAFGQLFALGLYSRYKKEGKKFAESYEKILADTGKMSCEDLCKKAGFDITTKNFWLSGIEIYKAEFEEMKKLLGRISSLK